jgi:hypothetical protein
MDWSRKVNPVTSLWCWRKFSHPVGIYLFSMAALQFLDTTDTYRDRRVEKLNRRDREIDMEIKTAELEDSYREPLETERASRRNNIGHAPH